MIPKDKINEKALNILSDFKNISFSLKETLDKTLIARQRDSHVSGVSTGLVDLDKILSGMQQSDLIILAGRPSMGKTALGINIAVNSCKFLNQDIEEIAFIIHESFGKKVEEDLMTEFQSYDKDLRILTYKVLLEKFNGKYASLNDNQKSVLKEFINSVDSTPKLKEFYNTKINEIKTELTTLAKKVTDKVVKIKLNEVNNMLLPLGKIAKVGTDDLVNLLQYYALLEELVTANG